MRITATDEGELLVGRRLPGRGAWVCPIETCVAMARRRKAFARALRRSLADGADDRFVAWFTGISRGTTIQTLEAVDAMDTATRAGSGAGRETPAEPEPTGSELRCCAPGGAGVADEADSLTIVSVPGVMRSAATS